MVFTFTMFVPAYAAEGLIKPSSKFYFLQNWGESIMLFLNFSKESKLDYLLALTERRLDEIKDVPSQAVADHYEENFSQLKEIASQLQNAHDALEKIKEASLRQQEVLAKVYEQVPEEAKDAIENAQENSSKHLAEAIEAIDGHEEAEEYMEEVEEIQKEGQEKRIEKMEQARMENESDDDAEEAGEPKEGKSLLPGQEMKSLNTINEGGSGPSSSGSAEREGQAPMAPSIEQRQ